MDKKSLLEKIELHILRIHRLLAKNDLLTEDYATLQDELRKAYEWSTVLQHLASMPVSTKQIIKEEQPKKSSPEIITPSPVVTKSEPVIIKQEERIDPPKKKEELKPKEIPMTIQEARVTLNDINSSTVREPLADKLSQTRIADLSKSIALHEKFLFINELFLGDNSPYNRFIEEANQTESIEQAISLINIYREQYQWTEENKAYQKLITFVQRKHI